MDAVYCHRQRINIRERTFFRGMEFNVKPHLRVCSKTRNGWMMGFDLRLTICDVRCMV